MKQLFSYFTFVVYYNITWEFFHCVLIIHATLAISLFGTHTGENVLKCNKTQKENNSGIVCARYNASMQQILSKIQK